MGETFDFAANGWKINDHAGFIGLVGPFWERWKGDGPIFAFQAQEKHENLRGVVQGGMLMTFADRSLGSFARARNEYRPQATVQLDIHFLGSVKIGDVVIGRARMVRNTRTLMFLEGNFCVHDAPVLSARGVWKKLGV